MDLVIVMFYLDFLVLFLYLYIKFLASTAYEFIDC